MKNQMKKLVALCLTAAMTLAMTACGNSTPTNTGGSAANANGDTTVLIASHVFDATHPWQLGLERMGELLYERTDGRYTIESYPSSALSGGSNRSIIEMVGTGSLDLMIHGALSMSAFDERYDVFTLPFLFPSREVAFKTANNSEIGAESMTWLENYGLTGLAFCENGMRYLTMATGPVSSPADLAGTKIRIPESANLTSEYTGWGADPTILNMSEVYTSLQQGVVDGQELPVPAITSNRLYEVAQYITAWDYCWDAAWLMINSDLYNGLSDADKQIFNECAQEAADYANELTAKAYETDLAMYEAEGCTITYLTDAQVEAFKESSAHVYDEYRQRVGDDLVDKMLAAVEANS